jgi:hypothetical protein
LIVGVFTGTVLFVADRHPSSREQIEEHTQKVEQRIEQAKERTARRGRVIGQSKTE